MIQNQGVSQRTCMNDPWTWIGLWGSTVGVTGQRKTKGEKSGQL